MNELVQLRDDFRRGVIDKHEYSRAISARHVVLQDYVELLTDSDIAAIEITAEGVWMHSRLAPVAIACDLKDRGTPPMVSLHFGRYEGAEFDMWRRLVSRGATIADIGANIGWYSAHMAAVDPTARIFAFEPVPDSFAWLARTLARNELTNVVAEQLAISDSAGQLEIFVDPTIAGAASAHPTVYVDGAKAVTVATVTLDDYAKANGLRFNAIKLDVEGGELAALQGARQVLTEQRPVVFTEMLRRHARAFGYHPNDIIDLMRSNGYSCYRIADGGLARFPRMEEDTVETNFFLLHDEAHREMVAAAKS